MIGDINKWAGIIFPSVLALLMVISGLFYLELNLYKKEQELATLTMRLYEGRILSDLAYQKIISLQQIPENGEGVIRYNAGMVKYRVKGEEIRMSIYIAGHLIYDEKEKMPTKKAIL